MIATTRGALMRGTTTDGLGDEVDALAIVATPLADLAKGRKLGDFPVSIIERTRREFDEASNAWRTVRYFAGRVPSYVPARAGDRIRDNVTGSIYIVSEAEAARRGLSGRASRTLTMKRTSSE